MTEYQNQRPDDRPLRRVHNGRLIAGVAAGIAEYIDVDVTVVRLAFAALAVLGGAGIPLYIAAWLFVPEDASGLSLAADLLNRHQTV